METDFVRIVLYISLLTEFPWGFSPKCLISPVINEYDCDTDQGMFDLAWEIEEEISEAVEYLEAIRDVIDELVELTPSEEDEFEDDETD